MRRRLLLTAFVLLLAGGAAAFVWTEAQPLQHPPGVLAPEAPRQTDAAGAAPVQHRGYRLTPVADFAAEARVLGTKRYRNEPNAALAPYDLAIGWGPMSDSAVLERLEIFQTQRAYTWRTDDYPIPPREIIRHSTNVHVIPATATAANALGRLKPGHLVRLRGRLVDVLSTDGDRWRTSTSRTDAGYGACEILWAEAIEIL